MLTVQKSRQMLRAHRKRTEMRRKVKNGKGERIRGVNWKGVYSNARCDKTRQNSVFFLTEKERKLVQEKEEEGRKTGGGRGGGGCLAFFKGIINSLSALVLTACVLGSSYLGKILFVQGWC